MMYPSDRARSIETKCSQAPGRRQRMRNRVRCVGERSMQLALVRQTKSWTTRRPR